MSIRNCLKSLLLIACAAVLAGCGSDEGILSPGPSATEFDAEAAVAWMDLAMTAVKTERLSPPVAARLYGYATVALYEAVVNGIPGNRSLVGQLNDLSEMPDFGDERYHWPTVANAAVATILRSLLANGSALTLNSISALEDQLNQDYAGETDADTFERSADKGKLVGLAIFDWSLRDGYPTLNNCAWTPPAGAGLWVPTPPAYAAALQPCWGNLRPFVIDNGTICEPGPPPQFSEGVGTPFYDEMMEVYNTVENLTAEQTTIANFWADNPGATMTPPGHSISIASQIIEQEQADLGAAAECFVRVGIAVGDAFIACWNAKFDYLLLRPVTCIRDLVDPDWLSPVATPPFPEYPSGHSVQSGAVAEVLTDMFGEDFTFTDHTHDDLGFTPRSFDSFFEFADEAAISRLYGGIHFRSAIENGIEQGKCIGEKINALQFKM